MPDTVHVVILRAHHDRPDLVLLDTPPELATVMGRFQPARYVGLPHGAYALPVDKLDAFATFTRANHVATIDDRGRQGTTVQPGQAIPLPECSTCGQPAKRDRPLRYCPRCGAIWHPVAYVETLRELTTTTCPACSTTQRLGFPICQHCGTTLPREQPSRHTVAVRQPLDDPLPLAVTIDETLADQARP